MVDNEFMNKKKSKSEPRVYFSVNICCLGHMMLALFSVHDLSIGTLGCTQGSLQKMPGRLTLLFSMDTACGSCRVLYISQAKELWGME